MKKLMMAGALCAVGLVAWAEEVKPITLGEVKSHDGNPWDGKLDVEYSLANIDAEKEYKVAFDVKAGGKTMSVENAAAKLEDKTYTNTLDTATLFGEEMKDKAAKMTISLIETKVKAQGASVPTDANGFDTTAENVAPYCSTTFVPGDYCVVDLTTGQVTEERNVQKEKAEAFTNVEYKTTKMVFRWVPEGKFKQTCVKKVGYTGELVTNDVTLSAYWMAVFPITEAQFNCVTNGGVACGGSMKPQVKISWDAFRGGTWDGWDGTYANVPAPGDGTFVKQLNAKIKAAGCKDTFDLCTSFQWERAARAGTRTDYFFADTTAAAEGSGDFTALYDYAWFVKNSFGWTYEVGGKSPNAWGLYDVYGNAYDWCLDWSEDDGLVGGKTLEDYVGAGTNNYRIGRGGHYEGYAGNCSSVSRLEGGPSTGKSNCGFRLVRKPAVELEIGKDGPKEFWLGPTKIEVALPTGMAGYGYVVSNVTAGAEIPAEEGGKYMLPVGAKVVIYCVLKAEGYVLSGTNPYIIDDVTFDTTIDADEFPRAIAPGDEGNPWKVGGTDGTDDVVEAWTNGAGKLVIQGKGSVTNLAAVVKAGIAAIDVTEPTVTGAVADGFAGFGVPTSVNLTLPDDWQGEFPDATGNWYGAKIDMTGFVYPLTMRNVTFAQRWPRNGKVDIGFALTGHAGETNVIVTVYDGEKKITNFTAAVTIPATGVLLTNLVWDASENLPAGFYSQDVQVKVAVEPITPATVPTDANGFDYTTDGTTFLPGDYCVVDLTTGEVTEMRNVQKEKAETFANVEYKTTKMVFRWVPAGKFKQSCAKTVGPDALKTLVKNDVTLSAYWMAIFQVTEAQFNCVTSGGVAGDGSMKPKAAISWNDFRGGTWDDWDGTYANVPAPGKGTFVKQLNDKIKAAGCKGTFDLCTSFQWERAARAGTRTDYFFSDAKAVEQGNSDFAALRDYAWFNKNSDGWTYEVGGKLPNAWGLYDVYGNRDDWCLDWSEGSLAGGRTLEDYVGVGSSYRIGRGCHYAGYACNCSSLFWSNTGPKIDRSTCSFRLVRKTAAPSAPPSAKSSKGTLDFRPEVTLKIPTGVGYSYVVSNATKEIVGELVNDTNNYAVAKDDTVKVYFVLDKGYEWDDEVTNPKTIENIQTDTVIDADDLPTAIASDREDYPWQVAATAPLEFTVDTRTGERVIDGSAAETFTYSAAGWDKGVAGSASIAYTLNGGASETFAEGLTGNGDTNWLPKVNGKFAFTHTPGDKEGDMTATFVVAGLTYTLTIAQTNALECVVSNETGVITGENGVYTINAGDKIWVVFDTTEDYRFTGDAPAPTVYDVFDGDKEIGESELPATEPYGDLVFKLVRAAQRYPWNGKVDIVFAVTNLRPKVEYVLATEFAVKDTDFTKAQTNDLPTAWRADGLHTNTVNVADESWFGAESLTNAPSKLSVKSLRE